MKTFILTDGSLAKLGENNKENWKLISQEDVEPDFYWFHLSAFPSGHLVLFTNEINKEKLHECYSICKIHSKYRNHRNLKVDCTKIKNLKKTEKEGEVEYKSNKKVKILDFKELLPYTNHKTFDITSMSSPNRNNFHTIWDSIPQKSLKSAN